MWNHVTHLEKTLNNKCIIPLCMIMILIITICHHMHFLLSIFSLLNLATESWMGCYTNMYVCHRAFPYLIYCTYADIDLYMWYIIQRCFLGIWRGVLLQGRLRMPTAYKPCLWNWPENLRQRVFTKLHVSLVLTSPLN